MSFEESEQKELPKPGRVIGRDYILNKFKEKGEIQVSTYGLTDALDWLIGEFGQDTLFMIGRTGWFVWTIKIA